MSDKILQVNGLQKIFKTVAGPLHAVDDISFTVERGTTLGIVGESGCGKSTIGRCVLRLIEPTKGEIFFDGTDLMKLKHNELRAMRQKMQIVFQDPFSSLDPRKTVMQSIAEPITSQNLIKGKAHLTERVRELMDTVGLAERLTNAYPHELDGGRRQRIGIARALAMNPQFIVCDEPVSALDVSIQAQILNLLKNLQKTIGLTYIFITHDLSVVNHVSDEIFVMYLGKIMEHSKTEDLFSHPKHPYTKALLSAITIPETNVDRKRILLKGEVSSPISPPDVCRFLPRCYMAEPICSGPAPELRELGTGHCVACHLAK